MGAAYALFSIFYFMYYIAIGVTAVGKTIEVLTLRPESTYTAEEARSAALYRRYVELEKLRLEGANLTQDQVEEHRRLQQMHRMGKLRSGYSYISSRAVIPVMALVGLMIAAMLAALMSGADAFMVSGSALFTMNLYRPLRPHSSEKHLVWVGRFTTGIIIVGGVLIA